MNIMYDSVADNICEILLENGAAVAVRNRKNITPKHVAHNARVAALLLRAAEDQGQGNTSAAQTVATATRTRRVGTSVP